jgi:RNA polymerase sigma-70 factor (ECF subfamily)
MEAALSGDRIAVAGVARRLAYIPRLMRALNSRAGRPLSDPDLEDASSEAVYAAWRKAAQYDGCVRLESWLYGFVWIEFRRARRLRSLRQPNAEVLLDQVAERPDHSLDTVERHELLAIAVDKLPDDERAAVALKHFDGLTFEMIAARLSIPVSTSKSRYYRGLRLLRGRLADQDAT